MKISYLLLFILLQSLSGQCKEDQKRSAFDGVVIEFDLTKHQSVLFEFTDKAFNVHKLEMINNSANDSTIIKKISTDGPISWSYGILNTDLLGEWKIMQYVFIAQPGDTLRLSYSQKPFLNTSRCSPINIVSEKQISFYSSIRLKPTNTDVPSKIDTWRVFYKYFNEAYRKESDQIKSQVAASNLSEKEGKQRQLICQIHYYKSLFDWLFPGDGTYFAPTADVLKEQIVDINNLLRNKDLFATNELLNVIDGFVRLKLIEQNINFANGIEVYKTAAQEDIGPFKPTYLAVCIKKCPVKTGNGYAEIISDYRDRYANTDYISQLDSITDKQQQYFPLSNMLLSSDGKTVSMKEIIGNNSQYTFIDFWASWCLPCRQQLPVLYKKKQKLKGYPIKFVSINLDEKQSAWKGASKKEAKYLLDNNFYLLPHLKKAFVNQFNINLIPRYIVLRGSRIVAYDFYQPTEPLFEKEFIELIGSN